MCLFQKLFASGLGVELAGTASEYQQGKIVDGEPLLEDVGYSAFDLRISYSIMRLFGKVGFFDPYIGFGGGYTKANNQGRMTYNTNFGLRLWLSENWGLDVGTADKYPFSSMNGTKHMQHSAGLFIALVLSRTK